jgi:hypothetical protein
MNYIRTKLTMTNISRLNDYFIVCGVYPTALCTGIYTAYTINDNIVIKSLLGIGAFGLVVSTGIAWPITVPIAITAYISTNAKNKKSNPYII